MILLFKTNLHPKDEPNIRSLLITFDSIQKVSFDFEDCDKVLKIESLIDLHTDVIKTLQAQGFSCAELQ